MSNEHLINIVNLQFYCNHNKKNIWRFLQMAQATATKSQEVVNLGDSLFNTWTNGLDMVYSSRKEAEQLLLQTFESQKETLEKVTDDFSRIEAEQKKLIAELRETVKENIQKVFGASASKAYEQWNAQLDEVSNRIQEIAVIPYKESINILNQSQDQFQQVVQNNIDSQQKIREDLTVQLKAAQKVFNDIYESNSKLALGLFK
jgi:Polyhydroxyalkanoic acid inclusion protein (PhaP_Bmeg)